MALLASVIASGVALSAETGRIKRKPPDAAEAERIASDIAMNDSLLQKGDIVVTDHGFSFFAGWRRMATRLSFLRCLIPFMAPNPSVSRENADWPTGELIVFCVAVHFVV